MAYSENPTQDTASTRPLSLFKEYLVRPGVTDTKDVDYVNVFPEYTKHEAEQELEKQWVKRDGVVSLVASQVASNVRGMHYWADQKKIYYAAGQNLYIYNLNTLALTTLSTFFATSTGTVGFCEFLYENNSTVLIVTDGTTLKSVDTSNTIVTCADPDMPAHLPYPIFLDGYLFLVKTDSADIYNSNLNDPMAWTAGDYISAEMEGDYILRIAKLNNYIVVFGRGTAEYFWDAGNATQSPLQRNDSPVKINHFLGGFAQLGNVIYFVGSAVRSKPTIYMLEDFKIKEVSTETISRQLLQTNTNPSLWSGHILPMQGHTFYCLTAGNTTFVLETAREQWVKFKYQGTSNFPVVASAMGIPDTGIFYPAFALSNNTSQVYVSSPNAYQDMGTNFTCTIITDPHDFGTLKRKTMSKLVIYADTPSVDSSVGVSWSDNDYVSWTSPVSVNLNQDLASMHRLGSFRSRAFRFTYTDNYPFRMERVDVDINKGTS